MIGALALAVVVIMPVSGLRTLRDSARLRRLDREAARFHAAMRDL